MSSVASANLIVTIVVVPVEHMVSNVLQLVLTAGGRSCSNAEQVEAEEDQNDLE